jgi:hypothetical protein
MKGKTTDTQIEKARQIAREITEMVKSSGGTECIVDDWGAFGNFSLLVYLDVYQRGSVTRGYYPKNKNAFNLRKINAAVKKVVKSHKDAILRSVESPQGVYRSNSIHGMRLPSDFEGYDRNYVVIDLDYYEYHEATNTFNVKCNEDENNSVDTENQLKLF